MELTGKSGIFGTKTRTNILLLLTLLEESHASELARILNVRLFTVQNSLDTLEQVGMVSGVVSGRERRVRLNPRFLARDELKALLDKLALNDSDLLDRVEQVRRRPRRAGKAI